LISKQKLKTRTFLILAVLLIFLFFITFSFFFIQQQKLKAKAKNFELEQKLLRSQMNPHFIFNSLIAIQSFVFENNAMMAGKYISDFAKLMRLILENSREEYISISKELETLNFYLELQKLRFENKFDFTINIDKDIETENVAIPPMLAQPIIENAIEHGIKPLKIQGFINISFFKKENYIFVQINDNGIGIKNLTTPKNSDDKKHKSYALKILQERLNNYTPKEKSKLTVVSSDVGTEVSFFTPYKLL
jgi:LytS/YehU family sensor histidine kinase